MTRILKETIRNDAIRVYKEEDRIITKLKKDWNIRDRASVYRKALHETLRNQELHTEINGLKKELSSIKEELEGLQYTLNDIAFFMARIEGKPQKEPNDE